MCANKHQIIGGRSTAGQNIKRKTTCTIFSHLVLFIDEKKSVKKF